MQILSVLFCLEWFGGRYFVSFWLGLVIYLKRLEEGVMNILWLIELFSNKVAVVNILLIGRKINSLELNKKSTIIRLSKIIRYCIMFDAYNK